MLDDLNKQIVKVLNDNARTSFVEIGRQVGLSAPSVAERIQKMEEKGYIEGYIPKLNLSKFDYLIQANIALKITAHGFKVFRSRLKDFPEIYDCISVTGEHCVFLRAAVKSNDELEVLIEKLTVYGHTNTSIILSDYSDKTFFELIGFL
ncbi:MAG: Lrp/AsnC family transcriptional regulator [Bacteroidota bacterium]